MPRPRKTDRPVEKTINIPSSITTKVDLILWSALEGKVPHAAWSKYVVGLIEADLRARAKLEPSDLTILEELGYPDRGTQEEQQEYLAQVARKRAQS